MKLNESYSEKRRPLGLGLGFVKTLVSVGILWGGINSLLISLAYSNERGAWVPLVVSGLLNLTGLLVLVSGIRQIKRSLFPPEEPPDTFFHHFR